MVPQNSRMPCSVSSVKESEDLIPKTSKSATSFVCGVCSACIQNPERHFECETNGVQEAVRSCSPLSTLPFETPKMHPRTPPAKPPRRKQLNYSSLSGESSASGNQAHSDRCKDAESAIEPTPKIETVQSTDKMHNEDLPTQNGDAESQRCHGLEEGVFITPQWGSPESSSKVFNAKTSFASTPLRGKLSSLKMSPSIYFTPIDKLNQSDTTMDDKVEQWCCSSATSNRLMHDVPVLQSPVHKRYHSDPVIPDKETGGQGSSCVDGIGQPASLGHIGTNYSSSVRKLVSEQRADPLIQEVKSLQLTNAQLRKQIKALQQRLDSLEEKQNAQKSRTPPESKNFADMVAQIYYAQRERENAMLMRMNLAIQERDMAFQQMHRLTQAVAREEIQESDSSDEDDDISKILRGIEATQSPSKLLCHRKLLLDRIHGKSSRWMQHNGKMESAVHMDDIVEHDDVYQMNSSQPRQWESEILDVVYKLMDDRDAAHKATEELKEELEAIKACYRFQRASPIRRKDSSSSSGASYEPQCDSLLQDAPFPSTSFSQSLKGRRASTGSVLTPQPSHAAAAQQQQDEAAPVGREGVLHLHRSWSTNGALHSRKEEKHLQMEFYKLQVQLEEETRARRAAEERCDKLERLVTVLRKKVNGLSLSVTV